MQTQPVKIEVTIEKLPDDGPTALASGPDLRGVGAGGPGPRLPTNRGLPPNRSYFISR